MYAQLSVLLAKTTLALLGLQIALAAAPSAQFQLMSPEPAAPVVQTQADVRAYISATAHYYHQDEFKSLFITEHESQFGFRAGTFDPAIKGPEKVGASWGIPQFYDQNPNFNKACAIELQCAVREMMKWLADGRENEWSTWANRYKWFTKECDLKTKSCE